MPQVRGIRILLCCLLFMMAVAAGCGDANTEAIFNPETGQHIGNWFPMGHKASAQSDLARCTECHGSDFTGGISNSSCRVCHINASASLSCSDCHGYPPAIGAHTAHTLIGTSCLDCHANTVGTSDHNGTGSGIVNVNIDPAYNARSGSALYSGGTCSNISCHGGPRTQTIVQGNASPPQSTPASTPNWSGSTIDVNTQCTLCHVLGASAGSPEWNSYYSGRHRLHVYGESIACYSCHDTVKLAPGHFTALSTPAMEGPASATLLNALRYSGGSCNPSAGGLSGCHGDEDWR